MNLFGVGPLELTVILIVGLIFVGPDRLPRLAADLARTIREIRKYTNALASEFNDVVKDVEKEATGEKSVWKEVTESIGGATQQVTEAVRGVRQDVFNASAPAPPGANGSATPASETPAPSTWIDIADPEEPPSESSLPAAAGPAPVEPRQ